MSFRLGLTGSIGMGKSTTADLLAKEGCEVWDADAAVHRLYAKGGAGVTAIASLFPDAIRDGAVSREALKVIIGKDPSALARIETLVHPLVAHDRAAFLGNCKSDIAVLDIPLLFETGLEDHMDAVICVSVSPTIQKIRVLSRPNMTEAHFNAILSKQMPDAEKRKRSDYVVITDTVEHARKQVQTIVREIRQGLFHA